MTTKTLLRSFVKTFKKPLSGASAFQGHVDDIYSDNATARGWVCKRNEGAPDVDLFVNGVFKNHFAANDLREDLIDAGFYKGRGFTIPLEKYLKPGTNEVELKFARTNQTITGGKKAVVKSESKIVTPEMVDIRPLYAHVIQAVCDLAKKPIHELRVLDLACAHGGYAIEMAALGAEALGIEGRAEWLVHANKKQELGLTNVEFVQDDVRNLTKEKYGEFDVVLNLGLIYHLDAPDVFEVLDQCSEVCKDFAIIETHITTQNAYRSENWRGKTYWGASYFEHPPHATEEQKLAVMGASLDNPLAFWFTKPSLCNILGDVGFTSVHEVRNPVPYLLLQPDNQVKIWGNRVTLAAIKGQPVQLVDGLKTTGQAKVGWPEDMKGYLLEDIMGHATPLPPENQ